MEAFYLSLLKVVIKRPNFRLYDRTTIVRVKQFYLDDGHFIIWPKAWVFYNNFLIKINKMLQLFNFCIKFFSRIAIFNQKMYYLLLRKLLSRSSVKKLLNKIDYSLKSNFHVSITVSLPVVYSQLLSTYDNQYNNKGSKQLLHVLFI